MADVYDNLLKDIESFSNIGLKEDIKDGEEYIKELKKKEKKQKEVSEDYRVRSYEIIENSYNEVLSELKEFTNRLTKKEKVEYCKPIECNIVYNEDLIDKIEAIIPTNLHAYFLQWTRFVNFDFPEFNVKKKLTYPVKISYKVKNNMDEEVEILVHNVSCRKEVKEIDFRIIDNMGIDLDILKDVKRMDIYNNKLKNFKIQYDNFGNIIKPEFLSDREWEKMQEEAKIETIIKELYYNSIVCKKVNF